MEQELEQCRTFTRVQNVQIWKTELLLHIICYYARNIQAGLNNIPGQT